MCKLTFSGLELRSEGEQALVLDVQLGVQLGEDDDLGPPVLGVGRPLLQPEQGVACGGQGQTPQAVAPLLLGAAKRRRKFAFKYPLPSL